MIGRALDRNNDLIVDKGRIQTVDRHAQVAQAVRSRLLMYYQEWFLDRGEGTPWLEQVFVKPVNMAGVESVIKSRILTTPGVRRLSSFSMDYDRLARVLKISFAADTDYGPLDIHGQEIGIR